VGVVNIDLSLFAPAFSLQCPEVHYDKTCKGFDFFIFKTSPQDPPHSRQSGLEIPKAESLSLLLLY
jgi:hypothetical protein